MPRKEIHDSAVIYYEQDEGMYVAHGVRTDQIGTGKSITLALADLIRAVDQVARLVEREPHLDLYRDAPDEIRQAAKHAPKLPDEMFEVAYKIAHDEWPEDMDLPSGHGREEQTYRLEFHDPDEGPAQLA